MKAVLLIHGFATDQNDFAPIVPYFWVQYDEVVCPNLPAHGKAARKERLDHKRIIAFVEELFDDLSSRHQTVDVVGFSMGGALALHLAATRKVNSLVLMAPANKFFAPFFVLNTAVSFLGCSREGRVAKKGKIQAKKYNLTTKEMRTDVRTALGLFCGTIVKKYTPKNLTEFLKVIRCCNRSLIGLAQKIQAPVLILWGRLDQFVRYGSIKHVQKYCETSSKIIYNDVSHIMLYSMAKYRICDDILRFLHKFDPPLLSYH